MKIMRLDNTTIVWVLMSLKQRKLIAVPQYSTVRQGEFDLHTKWITDTNSVERYPVLPYRTGDCLLIKKDLYSLNYMIVEEVSYIISHELSPKSVAYGYDNSGKEVCHSVFDLAPIVSLSRVGMMHDKIGKPLKPFFRKDGVLWFFKSEHTNGNKWVSEEGVILLPKDEMRIDLSKTGNREFFLPPFEVGDAVNVGLGPFRGNKPVRIMEIIDRENIRCSDGNTYKVNLLSHIALENI